MAPSSRLAGRAVTWIRLGLVVAVLAVYGQTAGFDFVDLDDAGYVTENDHVLDGLSVANVAWAFATTEMGNWHPLTWLSLMIDADLGGGRPAVFHVTNVLLHLINTLLLFQLLLRMTGQAWRAAFVAAVFAVHPLHVESVAWISERKDVLSTLFWFLATLAYARYVERPGLGRYALVLLAFVLGLMSKAMLVTLPLTLLLLDYWPLNRFAGGPKGSTIGRARDLLLEKLPLLVVTAVGCGVTVLAQAGSGAVATIESFPPAVRAANTLLSYASYIVKTIWPTRLAIPYPYDVESLTPLRVSASALLLVGVSLLAFRRVPSRPYLAVGWAWYLVTLVPVIGLVQVGSQAMADRYTYVPLIGLLVAAAWGLPDLLAFGGGLTSRRRSVLAACAGLVVGALAVTAFVQAGRWRGTTELFTHVLSVTERNKVAHNALGLQLHRDGRLDRAIAHYREALRIAPNHLEARTNLAAALGQAGRDAEALSEHMEILRLRPDDPALHANLGIALMRQGRLDDALERFGEALRIGPDDPLAHKGLGATLVRLGRHEEAAAHLERAVEGRPRDAEALASLGTARLHQGQLAEAEDRLTEALRLDPDNSNAHQNLGVLLARTGRLQEAIVQFSEVLRIDPADEGARRNLERARSMLQGKSRE